MKSPSILFCTSLCLILAAQISSAQTVAVGDCRPQLVSYSTISAAVAAVMPNSTVLVCPGIYPEQVTIGQILTLRGLKAGAGAYPVIVVPSGGLVGSDPVQLFVQGSDSSPFSVNVSNLVVDGSNSGFNCSAGKLTGIEYEFASGTLDNVTVRNQNPGGCGLGIFLEGGLSLVNTVNVLNSTIDDFDDTGILANSTGGVGFFVNLNSNSLESPSASVQAGIQYLLTDGLAQRNTIVLSAGTGLALANLFAGMTAKDNTIIGASLGIFSGTSDAANTITGNFLSNNGTGIAVSGFGGDALVKSNTIVESSIEAIDIDCSAQVTAEKNTIVGAPIGIANVASGDTISGNLYHGVPTKTTMCAPDQR